MNQGASFEEIEIKDGKTLLYIVFGANRWEFEKIDGDEMDIPEIAQGCLTRLMSTTTYLLKNWKRIHDVDRAMGEAGLTQEIGSVKSYGYSLKGIISYRRMPEVADARKYNAFLRIVADE